MSYRIGIIGRGFVGGAVHDNFKDCFEVMVWDTDPEKRTAESLEALVNWSDVIFVSVPTPMKDDGSCDISIVEGVVADIARIDNSKKVVIKSTVLPGTTERLAKEHNMSIGFNPEFLTEANAYYDFRNQPLIVLGADDEGMGNVLADVFYSFRNHVGYYPHIIQRTTKEAEMFKYLANCFLATKVIFANEFKTLCDTVGVNYSNLAEVAALDTRLGHTHWKVPGPDGKLGFGGSCFPKDTSALASYADGNDSTLWLLAEAMYINEGLRNK